MDRSRRLLVKGMMAAAATNAGIPILRATESIQTRTIPSDGQMLLAMGLGSWLTFDAPSEDQVRRANCIEVMRAFFAAGGGMIDSSPMYGFSQDVIGTGLRQLNPPLAPFSASKV